MQCARCGHNNISSFRFCEGCLSPLRSAGKGADDVVGRFFDDADLIEAVAGDVSRGIAVPTRFDLPWRRDAERLGLYGRGTEVDALLDAIQVGLVKRRLCAVGLHGEVGTGRTALLVAVRERLATLQPGTRLIIVNAQGSHRPFSLIERLLRLRFDIPAYLGGTIAGERFERSVEAFYGEPAGAEVARTCGPMLGFHFWNEHAIDFEDRVEQARRAREALVHLIVRDLGAPPTVIIVDDAGDADAESLGFLAQLIDEAPDVPAVIVLATDRRGAMRRPWLASLRTTELSPLADEVMAGIARKALDGVTGVDKGSIVHLVRHAGGRPGSLLDGIEQLALRGAIARTAETWTLQPERVAELIASGQLQAHRGSRFDDLSDFDLQVASMGAVFGSRFWLGGVVALLRADGAGARCAEELGRDETPEKVRRACKDLMERGLVLPERSSLLPQEMGFRFVEEGDCPALLEALDAAAQKKLAHRAAVWMQMVAGQRATEVADMLAPLWAKAGDSAHAAHVYLRAGEQALEEFRHAAARDYLEKARQLSHEEAADVHTTAVLGLGRLAEVDGRWSEAETYYRDALELAWRYRARSRGAHALQRLGKMMRTRGMVQQALEQLVPALQLYETVGDVHGLGSVCDDIGRCYWAAGRTEAAAQFLKRALEYRERIGDRGGQASTLTSLGLLSMSLGHLDQAHTYVEQAVQMQRELRNLVGLFDALNALAHILVAGLAAEPAVSVLEEAYELSKRIGNRRMQAVMQNNLGEVLMLSGRLEDGETLLYKAVEGAGRLGDHALLSDAARNLAVAARRRDDRERALTWARRSVKAAQSSDIVRARAHSHRTLAEILADGSETKAADEAYKRAEQGFKDANDIHELHTTVQGHAAFLTRLGRKAAAQFLLDQHDREQHESVAEVDL